jgi:hypothetical protein
MKLIVAFIASVVFLCCLILVYFIHINYFKVDVVFYAAIFDGALAVVIAASVLWICPGFMTLGRFEKFQLIIIWILAGYALAISVPTVIDRSLSFYILEKIQQRGGAIREDAFARIFTEEYVVEHRLIDVRLTEQHQSGTIAIENNCVLITPKGRMIADFSRSFRQHWLPKKRLLLNEYTDVLTDPFRDNTHTVDYKCRE